MTILTDDDHVFLMADCPRCRARYAVAADPLFPGQYHILHRDTLAHSHIFVGAPLLCLCAPLQTLHTGVQAALLAGRWVPMPGDDEGWLAS